AFEGLLIQVGIGGVHGSIAGKWTVGENCAAILHYDYKSWYPHLLMSVWEYGDTMREFYERRAELKAAGKQAQLGYKLAMNSVSGRLKFPYSSIYNPAVNNSMVLRGQLGLLWLAEVMSRFGQVVHINTDGIIVVCQSEPDAGELQRSQAEIEAVVGCELERDCFTTLIQLDMNNHAEVDAKGKLSSNGRFALNYNSSLPRYVVKRLLTPDAEITTLDYCLSQSAKKSLFTATHKGKEYPATQQFQYGDDLIPEKELRYVEVIGGKPIKRITTVQDGANTVKITTLSQSALLLNDRIPDAVPSINHDYYAKKYIDILIELESTASNAAPMNWKRLEHIPQKLKKDGTPYKQKKMECGVCGSDSVAINRHTGQFHCYKCASDILYRFADGLWYPAAQAKLYEDGEFEEAQSKQG
ncbi:MAG: hypothetical protein LBS19_04105, partial [Clostridiales bacterium]|nr:hypothetical protein [Clostridiales bacterium]